MSLEPRQPPRHLGRLRLDPLGRPLRRLAVAHLVDLQNGRIGDSVRERLQGQGLNPRRELSRDDTPAAGEPVEILNDHPAVENCDAVLVEQDRNLPSGFCRRNTSFGSLVSAWTISIR